MNEMRKMIIDFKKGENRDAIKQIFKWADEDLSDLKYADDSKVVEVENGLKFVSYRIRAFVLNSTFKKVNAERKIFKTEEQKQQYDRYIDFTEYLRGLKEAHWIPIRWEECQENDFSSIVCLMPMIENYLGHTVEYFKILLEEFDELLNGTDELFERVLGEISKSMLPLFKEALEFALKRVTVTKSDKEIVKFINITMVNKFIELQMKRDNIQRLRNEDGSSKYMKKEFNEHQDLWLFIFSKTLKHVGGLKNFQLYLTPKQYLFIKKLYGHVEAEFNARNFEAFHFDKNNKMSMNKRFFANLMEMEETNFKQHVNRCNKKIVDNFAEVKEEYWEFK